MDPVSPAPDSTSLQTVLARHSSRRGTLLPTLSALGGPPGLGVRSWRQGAASERRLCVQVSAAAPELVAPHGPAAAPRGCALFAQALAYLARRTHRPLGDL